MAHRRMELGGDVEGLAALSHARSRVLIAVQALEEYLSVYGALVGVGVPDRSSSTIRCFGGLEVTKP